MRDAWIRVAACLALLCAAPAFAAGSEGLLGDRSGLRLLDPEVDVATRRALFAQLESEAAGDPAPGHLYVLGSLYRRGDSAAEPAFAKDVGKAHEYLSRAALAGVLRAMAKMSVLELDAGNRFEANVWAQLYYHYRKDAPQSNEIGSDGFAAALIAKAQRRFDAKQLPALNDSVGRMITQYDAKIRTGIADFARGLADSGLAPTRSDRRALPDMQGKRPEAGMAEYYVGFDANGDVDRAWLLDAWPDASLGRVLRPIAMSYRVVAAEGVDLRERVAVLPIEYNDLRHRIRERD